MGENFGFGRKIWVWAKIVGLGENFMLVAKIVGSGENVGFGRNFFVWVKNLGSGRARKCVVAW